MNAKGHSGGGIKVSTDGSSNTWKAHTKWEEMPINWFKWLVIEFNDANPDVPTDSACDTIKDCYNCTLSSCGWDL